MPMTAAAEQRVARLRLIVDRIDLDIRAAIDLLAMFKRGKQVAVARVFHKTAVAKYGYRLIGLALHYRLSSTLAKIYDGSKEALSLPNAMQIVMDPTVRAYVSGLRADAAAACDAATTRYATLRRKGTRTEARIARLGKLRDWVLAHSDRRVDQHGADFADAPKILARTIPLVISLRTVAFGGVLEYEGQRQLAARAARAFWRLVARDGRNGGKGVTPKPLSRWQYRVRLPGPALRRRGAVDRHVARGRESADPRGSAELVASTPDEYVAIAAGLAADPRRLVEKR